MYTEHHKVKCQYCGKEIDVANIKRHEAACSNPNSKLNLKKNDPNIYHVNHDGLNCQYCNKECKNLNSLTQHELRCKFNPNRKDYNHLGEHSSNTRKGTNKYNNPEVAKCAESLKESYRSGKHISPLKGKPGIFKGRHHTEESKEKTRISTLNYINSLAGEVRPRYNKKACEFINNINKEFNWNLQHAENGGEVCVGGYFLDGYDKDLNIAFEYDEPSHYEDPYNNVLNESDISRMNFIKERLGCKFFRYNERLNKLYEVV